MKAIRHNVNSLRFFLSLVTTINLIACSNVGSRPTEIPSPTPKPSAIPITPVDMPAIVSVDIAPLRSLPDITSQQVSTLNRGSEIAVVGISSDGNWYLVRTVGVQGEAWVAAEFVTFDLPSPTDTLTMESPEASLVPPDTLTVTPTETPPQLIMTIVGNNLSATPVVVAAKTSLSPVAILLFPTATLLPIPTITPTIRLVDSPTATLGPIFTPTETFTAIPIDTLTETATVSPTPTATSTPVLSPTPTPVQ